jgi:MYXO-CTERM domain-containing protein
MRIAPGLLGFALFAACTSEFTFSDSVNSRLFEIKPRAEFGDELSTPYVLGAEFEVFVEDNEQETDFIGWSITSTNPKVLRLRDEPYRTGEHILALDVAAAGEGTAELLLHDNFGELRGSAAVEVLRPTRAKLFAAPIYALENPDFRGETARPRVLAGGTATFAVEYLHDDIRLQGATDIKVESTGALEGAVRSSELAHNRNWVQFTVEREGEHTAELWLGDRMVERVTVDGVGPGAIAGIELIDSDPATPDELAGEWLLVAQAVSEDKVPVYGVDFEWMLEERGAYVIPGDVFVYEHDDEEKFRRVTARAYGVETQISIRVADGEPASSNDTSLTCSVGGSSSPWALALVLFALGRRRRT